jgi:hypothetical protein
VQTSSNGSLMSNRSLLLAPTVATVEMCLSLLWWHSSNGRLLIAIKDYGLLVIVVLIGAYKQIIFGLGPQSSADSSRARGDANERNKNSVRPGLLKEFEVHICT